jgi:FlaA1/EpsC-like NDP-sugar epimerase
LSQGGLSQVRRASQELAEPPTPEDTNVEPIQSGRMAGRTVLVTGANGGIGRATALGLAMRVVLDVAH